MSAESDLYAAVLPAVTSIVGDRVYPDVAPQTVVLPCIAFSRTATEYVTVIHTGQPVAEDVAIEVWCMATTRAGADALADAMIIGAVVAEFLPADRRVELDSENEIWSTVVAVTSLRQL